MVSIAPNLQVYMQLIVPKGGFAFSQYSLYKCQGIARYEGKSSQNRIFL